MLKRRRRGFRKFVIPGLILFLFLVLICSRTAINFMSCDELMQDPAEEDESVKVLSRKYVITPDGKTIRKFNPYLKVKSFEDLSKAKGCNYADDKIQCPDVRHQGETVVRQTQLATIRMLKIFDRICRRLKLRYWLWSGTLLGAIRHKGYIPWDNDLDIAMPKKDYHIFLTHGKQDLPADIFFQSAESDPTYANAKKECDAKLRDRNSCFGRCIRLGCKFHDGLMIDLFVFEEKDNKLEDPYKNSITLQHNDVFPLKEVEFEGTLYYAPAKYEELLSKKYGKNYMEYRSPKEMCPPGGMTGIPWYSCEQIGAMEKKKQIYIIYNSLLTKSIWLGWYWS